MNAGGPYGGPSVRNWIEHISQRRLHCPTGSICTLVGIFAVGTLRRIMVRSRDILYTSLLVIIHKRASSGLRNYIAPGILRCAQNDRLEGCHSERSEESPLAQCHSERSEESPDTYEQSPVS